MLRLDNPTWLEIGLLLLALIGVIKHARLLYLLIPSCRECVTWSDEVFCQIYVRHEWVRLTVKLMFVVAAIWLLSQPTLVRQPGDDWGVFGSLLFRILLITIVFLLDWESRRAMENRVDIQQTLRAIEQDKDRRRQSADGEGI